METYDNRTDLRNFAESAAMVCTSLHAAFMADLDDAEEVWRTPGPCSVRVRCYGTKGSPSLGPWYSEWYVSMGSVSRETRGRYCATPQWWGSDVVPDMRRDTKGEGWSCIYRPPVPTWKGEE